MAEYKGGKLYLPNVTLVAMSSVKLYETVWALKYSSEKIRFGDICLISHRRPLTLPPKIRFEKTERLNSIDDFNYRMTYELHRYIKTDYALIVHADGYVVNPDKWDDAFLDYDYIGSPWPLPENDYAYRDTEGNLCRVGNSVSIRSKRLMEYPSKHNVEWKSYYDDNYNEDIFICCCLKKEMEDAGIHIAPFELALRFGREHMLPENKRIEPFVFHKWRGENANYPDFSSRSWKIKHFIPEFFNAIFDGVMALIN